MDPAVHYTLRMLVLQFFRDVDPVQAEFADNELSLLYSYEEPAEAELIHPDKPAGFSITDDEINDFIQGPCEDLTRSCVREEEEATITTFPIKNVRTTVRDPISLRCEDPVTTGGGNES